MNKKIQKKVLFICTTRNFKSFTRRATTEAIASNLVESKCICVMSFWSIEAIKIKSNFVKTIPFFYFFPYKYLKFNILCNINFKLNNLLFKYNIKNYEIVVSSTPHHIIFNNYISHMVKVLILSDPFHLMNYTYNDTLKIIGNADLILSTSSELKNRYLPTYFDSKGKKVKYWPNCVDSEVWSHDIYIKQNNKNTKHENKIKVGFAGNFMEVTDIKLLLYLIKKLPFIDFILAGENKFNINTQEYLLFNTAISFKNVMYKGYINYEILPTEVSTWDICIMIDKINEFSSYHHHNKMYQYLSLGKPVIYQKNHNDYLELSHVTFACSNKEEFVNCIKYVITLIQQNKFDMERAVKLASKNNSKSRAIEFFNHLNVS